MTVSDSVCRAGFHAVSAKDAARIVNIIDTSVALPGGDALGVGVFGSFDINTVCGTGGSAQKTAHTFLQAIFIALQNMNSTIARLKMNWLEWVIFRRGVAKHDVGGDGALLGAA